MMAPKRRPAKRKTKQYARTKAKKGKNTRKGIISLLLVIIAVSLLFGVYKGLMFTGSLFFSRNPNFEIKEIEITSDGRLSPVQLREYAGVKEGDNLFAVDFKTVQQDLEEKVPLVKSVKMQRRLPDTLVLNVIERVPVARIRWGSRGMPLLMDNSGVVLPPTRSGQSLPLIQGVSYDQLVSALELSDTVRKYKQLPTGTSLEERGVLYCLSLLSATEQLGIGVQVPFESFDLRYPEFIKVELSNGTSARFPRHSAQQKLIRLVSVLQLAKEQGRKIKTVDLTPDGRNIPTTYR